MSKDDIIAELRQIIAEQAQPIAELELQLAKAMKDSTNSSKSPSSDIVKPRTKKTDRRRKAKRGGQLGRPKRVREPLPPESADEQITYEINDSDIQERELTPADKFEIVQHIELLELPIHVTEHRLRQYLDGDDNVVVSDVPELKGPLFGPRMLAMIGWLKSRDRCSDTTIATGMDDVLQVPASW